MNEIHIQFHSNFYEYPLITKLCESELSRYIIIYLSIESNATLRQLYEQISCFSIRPDNFRSSAETRFSNVLIYLGSLDSRFIKLNATRVYIRFSWNGVKSVLVPLTITTNYYVFQRCCCVCSYSFVTDRWNDRLHRSVNVPLTRFYRVEFLNITRGWKKNKTRTSWFVDWKHANRMCTNTINIWIDESWN